MTQGWWQDGSLRVRHRIDGAVKDLFPCFYGGGGSCAFDRAKFLELGGFDELLAPFYLEDTDLGYMAWKRGWKVLYHPRSVVWHEHRGTIGKRFHEAEIQAVLRKPQGNELRRTIFSVAHGVTFDMFSPAQLAFRLAVAGHD